MYYRVVRLCLFVIPCTSLLGLLALCKYHSVGSTPDRTMTLTVATPSVASSMPPTVPLERLPLDQLERLPLATDVESQTPPSTTPPVSEDGFVFVLDEDSSDDVAKLDSRVDWSPPTNSFQTTNSNWERVKDSNLGVVTRPAEEPSETPSFLLPILPSLSHDTTSPQDAVDGVAAAAAPVDSSAFSPAPTSVLKSPSRTPEATAWATTSSRDAQSANTFFPQPLPVPTPSTHVDKDVPPLSPQDSSSEPNPSSWLPLDLRNVELNSNHRIPEITPSAPVDLPPNHEGQRRTQQAVTLGFELLQRGAPYSARSRFVEAFQILARSRDDLHGGNTHRTALRKALDAYHEAADFLPKPSRPDQDVDLSFVLAGHTTDVLKNVDVRLLTPHQCLREYLALAEQEFVNALGTEALGSRALYGLARLELSPHTTGTAADVQAHRAMALFQSAMKVDPGNYAAANELGVLLARYGKTEAAIASFQHSVAHASHPTAWKNLARLHQKLGQENLARGAAVRAQQAARTKQTIPFAVAQPSIQWVAPEQFSRTQPPTMNGPQVARQPHATPAPTPQPPRNRTANRFWPFGATTQ